MPLPASLVGGHSLVGLISVSFLNIEPPIVLT